MSDRFYYPLSINDIKAARDEFLRGFIDIVKNGDSARDRDIAILSLNIHTIITEILTLFTAETLIKKGTPAQIKNYTPAQKLLNSESDILSIYVRRTQKGIATDAVWKKAVRMLKSRFSADNIPYIPHFLNKKNHVLTFSNAPLIVAHKRETGVHLVRNSFSDWYPGPLSLESYNLKSKLQETILKLSEKIFKSHGLDFLESTKQSIGAAISVYTNWTNFYLRNVEAKKKHLPDVLWVGSSGVLPVRALTHVARQEGRYVCGHDHGTGSGWLDTADQTILEFNYIDQFYTFSPLMAEELQETLHKDMLFNPGFLEDSIVCLKYSANVSNLKQKKFLQNPPKRLLFIATIYMKDTTDFIPRMPYDVCLEWHGRLFAFLKEQGYEVILRKHPEDPFFDPAWAKKWGVSLDQNRSLEESCAKADCAMLDFSCTTALVELLRFQMPIVLLDSGHEIIHSKALERIRRSLVYMRLAYDENNAVIMPENLKKAVDSAVTFKSQNSFLEYFGS